MERSDVFRTLPRLPRYIFAQLLGALLILAFAPLLTAFIPFFALLLVILLVAVVLVGSDKGGRWRMAWECVLLLIFLVPVLALLRGATVGLWHHSENGMRVMNLFLQPVALAWGEGAIAWVDLGIAVAGGVAILLFTMQDSLWRISQRRKVTNLPRSRARSVAMGLVQLSGVARALDDRDAREPILRVTGLSEGAPVAKGDGTFWLEDETGRVRIETRGARITVDPDLSMGGIGFGGHSNWAEGLTDSGTSEVVLSGTHEAYPGQYVLMPGDPVYVLGIAQPHRTGDDEQAVIRPERRLFRDHYHQVFFLASGCESLPGRYFFHGFYHGWVFAAFTLAFCTWLGLHGWLGTQDFEVAYGYTDERGADLHAYDPYRLPVEKRWWKFQGRNQVPAEIVAQFDEFDALELSQALEHLDRLQAQEIARPALERIIRSGRRDMHLNLARSWLGKWGYQVPVEPRWDHVTIRVGGALHQLAREDAKRTAQLSAWVLRTCGIRDGRGGDLFASWSETLEGDRLAVTFVEPAPVPARGAARAQEAEALVWSLDGDELSAAPLVVGDSRMLRYGKCDGVAVLSLLCDDAIRPRLPVGWSRACP